MEYKDKILRRIEKLETSTKMFLDLPNETNLPNGWGKRELAIHLFSWDSALVEFADNLRKGKTFDWKEIHPEDLDLNEVNKGHLVENEDLTFEEAIEAFTDTRMELIATYVDIVNSHFQDEKSFTDYFTMWMHDEHHLKQAGIDTKKLEEK
jgi:hypothetical protein